VKLDNFPVFSTKNQEKSTFSDFFLNTNYPHLDFKFLSFAQKRHYICILKLIVRIKKKSKKNYGTILTTASNHCAVLVIDVSTAQLDDMWAEQ
jgi:hypothetical protein